MIDSFFRKVNGRLRVLCSYFSRPVKLQRSEQETKHLAKQTRGMALYDYKWCTDSLKARQVIHHLNIDIERRDIQTCPVHQDNLLSQFGKLKVPCLRIEEAGAVHWLDEPDAIVDYLHKRFDKTLEPISI